MLNSTRSSYFTRLCVHYIFFCDHFICVPAFSFSSLALLISISVKASHYSINIIKRSINFSLIIS